MTKLQNALRQIVGWDWGMIGLTMLITLTMLQKQNWVIPKVAFGLTPGELLRILCAAFWFFAWLSNSPRVLVGRTGVRIGALLVPLATLASYGWIAAQPGSRAFLVQADVRLLWTLVDALVILFVIDVARSSAHRGYVIRLLTTVGLVSASVVLVESIAGVSLSNSLRIPLLLEKDPLQEYALVRYGLERAPGLANHPLEAGAVIAILAPLCLSLALFSRTRTSKYFWWGAFLLMTAAVLSSISRSSIVGLVAGVAVVALVTPTRQVGPIAVVLLAGSGLTLLVRPGLAQSLLLSVTESQQDVSIQTRTASATETLADFSGLRWVFGLADPDLPPLDNLFLMTLALTGLLGVAVLASRYLLAANAGIQVLRTHHDHATRAEVGGLLGAWTVTIVVALALDVSYFNQAWLSTLLVIGLLGASQAHAASPMASASAGARADDAGSVTTGRTEP
jgi:hypothetical protein